MILDAYNILHRTPAWRSTLAESLETGRDALLAYCRRWIQQRGDVWLFIAVFDGDSSITPGQTSGGPGVRVVFSASGQAADDRILDILTEFGDPFDYVVVSDDRYVMTRAKLLGAAIMTAAAFVNVLQGTQGTQASAAPGMPSRRHTDPDDALPSGVAHDITESLRRLWGG